MSLTALATGARGLTVMVTVAAAEVPVEVYTNLKRLLDDPSQLEPISRKGRAWAEKYVMRESAGSIMRRTLDAVVDGSYSAPEVRM